MKNRTYVLTVVLTLSLGGCEWIDDVGRHKPVVGERCENWECFTQSGQAQSEATKRASAERKDGKQKRTPINAQGTPNASQPTQPQNPMPFDMPPEQLDNLPAPSAYPSQ